MAQQNVGFDFLCPQAADRSYGALTAGSNTPYPSVAAAVAAVNAAFRYRGKTVGIDLGDGSGLVEYWWRVGTADSQLVKKILVMQSLDLFVGDGGTYTPADGATTLINPILVNCVIVDFQVEGMGLSPLARTGFSSYVYTPSSGTITLVNKRFALNTWYSVKYRQL